MESALLSLRDVEGVLGSFVLDAHGSVLARDMPAMFDVETLLSASVRLAQLRAALEANGDEFDGCTARFGAHLVVLRAASSRTLCVLCPLGVNLTTLQMGLNLVARRVSAGSPPRAFANTAIARASWPAPLPEPRSWTPPATSVPGHMLTAVRDSAAPPQPLPVELAPQDPEPSLRFFRGRPVP